METVTCAGLLVIPTWLEADDSSSRPLLAATVLLPLKSSSGLANGSSWAGVRPPHPHQEPAGSRTFEPEEDR